MDPKITALLISIAPEAITCAGLAIALVSSKFKLQKTKNELELQRLELEKKKLEYAQSTDTIFSAFLDYKGGKENATKINKEEKQ